MDISASPTLSKYKNTLMECLSLYYPELPSSDLSQAIDYSINKRLKDSKASISNSYKRRRVMVKDENGNEVEVFKDAVQESTLLKISDYILSREPIVCAHGTLFKHHGTIPNPLFDVVQSFLDNRTKHKKQMFQFPKGSEDFEKYNLLQSLIDNCLGTPHSDMGVQTI